MSYDTLLARLNKPRRAALRAGVTRAHRAHCPACQADGSGSPALSFAESETGGVLITCFAGGCTLFEVAGAAGVDPSELFPPRESSSRGNGGPGAWASAAALADAVADAAADVTTGGVDAYLRLASAVERFRAAARQAMRQGVAK